MSQDSLAHKQLKSSLRRHQTRARLSGSAQRPRLSVNISNLHISAQIIDDTQAKTLAYATTVGHKVEGNMTDKAAWVGTEIAKKAQKAKVKKIVFDRGEGLYHGRVKRLADAAREGGLEF